LYYIHNAAMAQEDTPGRKSVAFKEATNMENGESEKLTDGASTAQAHSTDKEVEDMTEMFNATLKKKSKKKPSTAEGGEANGEETTFDPLAKKKKSKSKEAPAEGDEAAAPADGEETGFDASLAKKKKRSKKNAAATLGTETSFDQKLAEAGLLTTERDENGAAAASAPVVQQTPEEIAADLANGSGIWSRSSNAPLQYHQLLSRFFILLHEQHPDLAGDGRSKTFKIPPPQVMREGNKKSIFANLPEICRKMKRTPDHVIQFLFAELGTSGSVDGAGRLVIKGRFQQKQLENVLRRYILEYLTCKTCKSPDTILNKENRLYFITCNVCGSRKSVSTIKTGFQAAVGKRKRMQT